MKSTVAVIALAIFGFGFHAAYLKSNQVKADQIQQATSVNPAPESPQPTPTSMATLQIFDGATKAPLIGQSIVILTTDSCVVPPCPTNSPQVVTADERGRIVLSQETLRLRPKIYATGYKLDTYFSFLDSAKPNILTLYQPMEGTKVNYDITLESVPIGLTSVKSP